MSIFVKMHDNFMSGWGDAAGKTNIYVIECDTQAQADQIVVAANKRNEMSRIRQVSTLPKSTEQTLVTVQHFSDLGPIWTGVAHGAMDMAHGAMVVDTGSVDNIVNRGEK